MVELRIHNFADGKPLTKHFVRHALWTELERHVSNVLERIHKVTLLIGFGDEREPLVDDGLVLFLHRLSHGVRLRFDDVGQIRIKHFIVQFVNQPCGDA